MSTQNGIPLYWDEEADKNLFGGLFQDNLFKLSYFNENTSNNFQNQEYVNPLLKRYLREDGIPIKTEDKISAFEHKSFYNLSFISFSKGSNMMDYHNNKKPDKNEMWILYEEDNAEKSNLFGSFVLVKMGDGYHEYLKRLKNKSTSIVSHTGNNTTGVIIDSYEKEIQEDYDALLKRTEKISKEKFVFALETEMRTNNEVGKFASSIFGNLNSLIEKATEGINKAIEGVKFVKEDYTPQEKNKDLSLDYLLAQFVEINSEIVSTIADYAIPDIIEENLATAFTTFTSELTKFAKENLPKETIAFFEKVYQTFQDIVAFFKEAAKYFASLVGDSLYLLKAFTMGLINGLLSTIQMIVSVIGWLLKTDYDKKLTGQYYLELESKFEFIEDLLDLITETASSIFSSIFNLLKDFSLAKIKSVLALLKGKASHIDRFDTAYFLGNFIFEVILGVALTFFTGGAAAVAEATNAAEKATAFLKIFAREMISTATMGIVDILQLFKILIAKFVNACKTGWKGFKAFLEKLLASKTDDIVKEEGKVLDEVDDSIQSLSDSELDWMASRKTGNLGGKVLTASQIRKLRGILKEKGIHLIVEGDLKSVTKLFIPADNFNTVDDLFYAMRTKGFPGGFNAHTKQFYLSKSATEIVGFHEMAHLKHFEEIGDSYLTLSKLDKETHVWEQILANRSKWTKAELQDALNYINDIRTNPIFGNNLNPLKIKI